MTEYAACPFDSQTSQSKVAVYYNKDKKGYVVHSFGGDFSYGEGFYIDLMDTKPEWKIHEKVYPSLYEKGDGIEMIFKQSVVFK